MGVIGIYHVKRSQAKAVNSDEGDRGDKKNSGIKVFLHDLVGNKVASIVTALSQSSVSSAVYAV